MVDFDNMRNRSDIQGEDEINVIVTHGYFIF